MSYYSRHQMSWWLEQAANPRLPLHSRLYALALGSHRANGHALFHRGSRTRPGDIAVTLGTDRYTGEVVPVAPHYVRRLIDQLVDWGQLEDGSNAACLIVPRHAVSLGVGDPNAPCPIDHIAVARKHREQRERLARQRQAQCPTRRLRAVQ